MKKQVLAGALCLGVLATFAQLDSHPLNLESTVKNLDKTVLTTPLLLNKAFHIVDFLKFSPQNTRTITYDMWKQMYIELYNSHIAVGGISTFDQIKKHNKEQIEQGQVPLLVLDYDYNYIDTLAIKDSLLTVDENGVFFDVPNRSRSPYLQGRVAAFSPAVNSTYLDEVNFVINREDIYTNRASIPVAIRVNFGDGNGFVTMNWGVPHPVSYANIAEVKLTMEVDYDNGETLVLKSAQKESSCFDMPEAPNHVETITAHLPYLGEKAKIDIYVRSAANKANKEFWDKPVIFVEGLNFDEDSDYQKWKHGSVGWCSFWGKDKDNPEFADSPLLLQELVDEGYDIIFVDFHDGADYIQRNAFALVSLLQALNGKYQAGPSVIIGPSMGGQVSRYALKYMEQHNMPHCSRLWISVDSPHQGANIPVGIQYFLDFYAREGFGPLGELFSEKLDVYDWNW